MNFQETLNQLQYELSHLVVQTEANSSVGLLDHHLISENLVCEILKISHGFEDLRNLNSSEQTNYPAIDLADYQARVAIQVTATSNLAKIKETLRGFVKYDLGKSFDRLIVFILTRKQKLYSQPTLDQATQGVITFNSSEDIIDYHCVLKKARHLHPTDLNRLLQIVREYNHGVSQNPQRIYSISREYTEQTLSLQKFSLGLRERLENYHSELQYLTIEQVTALEAALREPLLWVQGDAGTGKTIFAVEAAYRSLQAGMRVLIVFRSSQFKHVFRNLLADVGQELFLLQHMDFLYLLRQFENEGRDGKMFIETAKEMLPNLKINQKGQLFDLLIVDDCGAYDAQLPQVTDYFSEIGFRVICLAATDQIYSALSFDYGQQPGIWKPNYGDLKGVLIQVLLPPEGYYEVELQKNVRNACRIIDYAGFALNRKVGSTCIKEDGIQQTISTNWKKLDKDLLKITATLLEDYPPERIRILVDPHIHHPDLEKLSPLEYEENKESFFANLAPLSRAILTSAQDGNFLHTTLEADEMLQERLAEQTGDSVCFIYTDGEEVGIINDFELMSFQNSADFLQEYRIWQTPRVQAKSILDIQALKDPFESANAILIYQSPLFIGLESDVVIYIRNKKEEIYQGLDKATELNFRRSRLEHHYLAMSRAKIHLVDLLIN